MNNKLYIFALLLTALVIPSCKQEQKPQELPKSIAVRENPMKTIREIRQMEDELINGYINRDSAGLSQIINDEFTIGLPTGKGFGNKNTELEGLRRERAPGFIFKNDTMEVSIFGNTAIVTRLFRELGKYQNKRIETNTIWTDTWVKWENRWQIVSTHGSYVPADSL